MNKHVGFYLLFIQATVMCMTEPNKPILLEVPKYGTSLQRLSNGRSTTAPIPLTKSAEIRMRQDAKSPTQPITPGDYFWVQGSPSPTYYPSSK